MYFEASVRYLLSEGPEYNNQRGSTAFCTQVVEWLVELSGDINTCNHTAVRKAICFSNIPRTYLPEYRSLRLAVYHKPIRVYMGGLMLGVNTLEMIFWPLLLSQPWSVKG